MGDFVYGKVFADVSLRGFPQEGALRGVQLGQKGAVALGGPKGGSVGDRHVEATGGWVDLRGGRGKPEGGHALTMFYQERKGQEAGLDGQDDNWSRRKAVGDPSLDASPEGVESVLHFHEGGEEVGAI